LTSSFENRRDFLGIFLAQGFFGANPEFPCLENTCDLKELITDYKLSKLLLDIFLASNLYMA